MRVTFLIGNGFDLGLGMYTKFEDMYARYLETFSKTWNIASFKEALEKDAPDYETWSDFEMGMAKYAMNCSDENAVIECVRDFKAYMVNYLIREEALVLKKIKEVEDYKAICAEIVNDSFESFYKSQSRNTILAIENAKNGIVDYHAISFNYTEAFDFLFNCYNEYYFGIEKAPIHVHGILREDVVLGIDNEQQIYGAPYTISNRLRRAFIKPYFNENYDWDRVQRATHLIKTSNVVCVYGMSLGESDKMWTNLLVDWLHSDKRNMLFYFQYGEESYKSWERDLIMDIEDEKKETFLRRITDSEEEVQELFNQVHIPVGDDIFDFRDVL